jgi:hypothetical protein
VALAGLLNESFKISIGIPAFSIKTGSADGSSPG